MPYVVVADSQLPLSSFPLANLLQFLKNKKMDTKSKTKLKTFLLNGYALTKCWLHPRLPSLVFCLALANQGRTVGKTVSFTASFAVEGVYVELTKCRSCLQLLPACPLTIQYSTQGLAYILYSNMKQFMRYRIRFKIVVYRKVCGIKFQLNSNAKWNLSMSFWLSFYAANDIHIIQMMFHLD